MLVSFVGALQIIIIMLPLLPSRNHLELQLLHKRILQSINIIIIVVVHQLLLVLVVDCDAINRPVLAMAITPTTTIIISVTTIIIMRMATAVMISIIQSTPAMSTVSDASAVSARPVYPASLVLDPDHSDNIDDGGLFPWMIRRLV
jgi:hypothetical protein